MLMWNIYNYKVYIQFCLKYSWLEMREFLKFIVALINIFANLFLINSLDYTALFYDYYGIIFGVVASIAALSSYGLTIVRNLDLIILFWWKYENFILGQKSVFGAPTDTLIVFIRILRLHRAWLSWSILILLRRQSVFGRADK